MAAVTENDDGKNVADDDSEETSLGEPKRKAQPVKPVFNAGGGQGGGPLVTTGASSSGGFFTIYKSGQGYWTRMGSAAGAAFLALLTAYNVYRILAIQFSVPKNTALGVAGAMLAAVVVLCFYLINKPTHAQFLIDTDQEMKKVNWTSRAEIIGSTKIVIIFMFLIAAFLFVIDILFGYFFYLIHVLKSGPFGGA